MRPSVQMTSVSKANGKLEYKSWLRKISFIFLTFWRCVTVTINVFTTEMFMPFLMFFFSLRLFIFDVGDRTGQTTNGRMEKTGNAAY